MEKQTQRRGIIYQVTQQSQTCSLGLPGSSRFSEWVLTPMKAEERLFDVYRGLCLLTTISLQDQLFLKGIVQPFIYSAFLFSPKFTVFTELNWIERINDINLH